MMPGLRLMPPARNAMMPGLRLMPPVMLVVAFLWAPAQAGAAPEAAAGAASAAPSPAGDERACLGAYCDSLLARQGPQGLYEEINAAWWRAGIATRALLGGYQVLGDERYLQGALRTVRAFLREQRYEGSWFAEAYETIVPQRRLSRNIADLGVMTTALVLAAHFAEEPEREAFLGAHRDYLRLHVARHDLVGGAFSNGLFEGTHHPHPYSVATATEAQALICQYRETGERACLARAEEAAQFLLASLRPDGRFTYYPHDHPRTRPLDPTDFQESYYLLDALLWVCRHTDRPALGDELRAGLLNHLWGEAGLLDRLRDPAWMLAVEGSGRAKAFGMVGLLAELGDLLGPVAGVGPFVAAGRQVLCELLPAGPPHRGLARDAAGPATGWTVDELAFAALALAQIAAPDPDLRF